MQIPEPACKNAQLSAAALCNVFVRTVLDVSFLQTHTSSVIAIPCFFLSQAFLSCHGDSCPCCTFSSYACICAKLYFLMQESKIGDWLSVKPSSVARHCFSCFFLVADNIFVSPRLLRESLRHADTDSLGFMSLFSRSGENPWLTHPAVMLVMTTARVYVYIGIAVMRCCMLSGTVRGIVGNRLWQTEKEMESYNISGLSPAVTFWPEPRWYA